MKKTILILTLLCAATITQAQVGIGTSSPASSSQLDVTSTTKGLLPPRMTTSQRDAITSPATGLQIYNTDNRAIETFTGTTGKWFTIGRGKGAITTNTAVGVNTLNSNTTGLSNTATGNQALYNNTSGFSNTANGYRALFSNSTGFRNTANGYQALYFNNTGSYNTANGYNALYNNTTGSNNTANSGSALYKNTTGSDNTANGYAALYSNTSGFSNTANGYQSLFSNTTGSNNTANGYQSLFFNTTGGYNTANGYYALYFNTTGGYNTANSYYALFSNTTGSNNTALGYNADVGTSYLVNAMALGYGASVTGSNKVRIGNSSVSDIEGQVAFTSVSDGRIKENVQEAVPGLSFISQLRPVTYTLNTRKQDEITMQAMPDSIKEKRMLSDEDYLESSSIVRTGFIAQEVEVAAKKVGFDFDGVSAPQNETDLYGIRYAEFVVPLVKAMQEQQAIIEQLKERIEALEKS